VTRERLVIFRRARSLGSIATKARRVNPGVVYYVNWRLPRRRALLRFCVRAFDMSKNASARSCAPLRVR
jgi:hypothetical protein